MPVEHLPDRKPIVQKNYYNPPSKKKKKIKKKISIYTLCRGLTQPREILCQHTVIVLCNYGVLPCALLFIATFSYTGN